MLGSGPGWRRMAFQLLATWIERGVYDDLLQGWATG